MSFLIKESIKAILRKQSCYHFLARHSSSGSLARYNRELENDFQDFTRGAIYIPEASQKPLGKKKALILSFSPDIYLIKLELMLALGLRLQGWQINFLLRPEARWAHRYFNWSKLGKIIYWDDFVGVTDFLKVRSAQQTLLAKSLTFQGIKNGSIGGLGLDLSF